MMLTYFLLSYFSFTASDFHNLITVVSLIMVERGMNEITDLPISRDYQNDFDAEWYLDTYYSTCDDGDFLSFILKSFHRVFHTGKYLF